MRDIMLDIETLSTDSNAAVTTISAVEFNLETGEIGNEFEVALDLKPQVEKGAVIDSSTVVWWFSQAKEAIIDLFNINKPGNDLALMLLNEFVKSCNHAPNNMRIWGNGCGFDNVIVRNLYKRLGKEFTLPYWCDNDVRTLVSLGNIDTRNFKFEGTKHRGIDDCKHQIKYCCAAYKGL